MYLRCLGNGFVLDDPIMFVRNPDLRHWSFLWKAFTRNEFWYSDACFLQVQQFKNYRPLFLVWCWIDYHLFGLNPAPWHATILAMYLIVVWLVFKIARRLTEDSTSALLATPCSRSFRFTSPRWCGWRLHVTCSAPRLDWRAFYLILPRADGTQRNWTAAIALYAGALLCHESMTAFPALVACYAFLFDPDDSAAGKSNLGRYGCERVAPSSGWRHSRSSCPLSAREATAAWILRRQPLLLHKPFDRRASSADSAEGVRHLPDNVGNAVADAAQSSVLPVSSALSPEFWVPLAAIVLVVAAFLVAELRDPRRRLHLFCAAWMGVTLAPMMVLHQMPHLVQDYYLFLPSVGWCILLGDVIAVIARQNAVARRLAFGVASVMLIVYAVTLWRVEPFWHDDVAIGRGYIEGDPESVEWHWNLAIGSTDRATSAGAEQEIRTALSLEPDRTGTVHPFSNELHHSLGELLARRGDIDGAVAGIREECERSPG